MRQIFLDTGGILALVNKRDALHQQAVEVNQELILANIQFIITDYILTEVGNALSRNKALGIQTLNYLTVAPDVKLVRINESLFNQAIQMYQHYHDKEWGLTDITSFVVMEQLNIAEAFAKDKHFSQYGFSVLLK